MANVLQLQKQKISVKYEKIIQQFGGPKRVVNINEICLGTLTPTKRKLVQNRNTQILLNNFENTPADFNPENEFVSG